MPLQTQLYTRFLFLLMCHKKSDDYATFVATFGKATFGKVIESLPITQLQLPTTRKLLTEKWVWLKRSVASDGCLDVDINGRSLLYLFGSRPLDLQVSYLEQELGVYLESRHPLHPAVVAVLRDLVSLQTQLGNSLWAAYYSIQLAGVCLHCSPLCSHSMPLGPEALLDQALETLVSLDHTPNRKFYEGLATAHLWKAILVFQHNTRYIINLR